MKGVNYAIGGAKYVAGMAGVGPEHHHSERVKIANCLFD